MLKWITLAMLMVGCASCNRAEIETLEVERISPELRTYVNDFYFRCPTCPRIRFVVLGNSGASQGLCINGSRIIISRGLSLAPLSPIDRVNRLEWEVWHQLGHCSLHREHNLIFSYMNTELSPANLDYRRFREDLKREMFKGWP